MLENYKVQREMAVEWLESDSYLKRLIAGMNTSLYPIVSREKALEYNKERLDTINQELDSLSSPA